MKFSRATFWAGLVLLAGLALVPLYAQWAAAPFVLTFTSRVLIMALAALSLNLILGYGGMVSFGHALYLGLGAYAVGLLAHHEIGNGWLQLLATVLMCSLVGALTGLVSLRTTGIAFIMITLAFSQLFFYFFVSLKQYGGDDGLSITLRSDFGLFSLASPVALYYCALGLICAVLLLVARIVQAPYGMVLQGCRMNERRMQALGFKTLRYRLTAYVLSCVVAGIAGLLYANLTGYASPAYMAWTISGELIVMVVLGGMGTVLGPLVGALALLGFEEILKAWTEHWQIILGPLIVLIVLVAKRGLYGFLLDWDAVRARRAAATAATTAGGGSP